MTRAIVQNMANLVWIKGLPRKTVKCKATHLRYAYVCGGRKASCCVLSNGLQSVFGGTPRDILEPFLALDTDEHSTLISIF